MQQHSNAYVVMAWSWFMGSVCLLAKTMKLELMALVYALQDCRELEESAEYVPKTVLSIMFSNNAYAIPISIKLAASVCPTAHTTNTSPQASVSPIAPNPVSNTPTVNVSATPTTSESTAHASQNVWTTSSESTASVNA
jgi:hypothetical protein